MQQVGHKHATGRPHVCSRHLIHTSVVALGARHTTSRPQTRGGLLDVFMETAYNKQATDTRQTRHLCKCGVAYSYPFGYSGKPRLVQVVLRAPVQSRKIKINYGKYNILPQHPPCVSKKRQILVIGHNTNGCTPKHEEAAYEVGSEIANSGAVLVTGGLGGVMQAASKGAATVGGLTVGIIPQDDASAANEYCDIVIPTGMGFTRDFLNALSADGIVIVGGGAGTLSEVCAAYMHKRPMVAIRGLGGSVEPYIDGYLDHRQNIKIVGVDTPIEAVRTIIELTVSRQ